MKKLFAIFFSFLLVFTLWCTATTPLTAQAAINPPAVGTQDPDLAAKQVFENLSPEAKTRFLSFLQRQEQQGRTDLLDYHVQEVDSKGLQELQSLTSTQTVVPTAFGDALDQLEVELEALALPVAVEYSFVAVGVGIAAATVDGPLPIGDIVAVLIAIGAGVVVGIYWDEIESKWDGIVDAFGHAFDAMCAEMIEAFNQIKGSVIGKQISEGTIPLINGRVLPTAQKHMEEALVTDLIGYANRNPKDHNVEVFLNPSAELMVVFDVTANIQGTVNRHLGNDVFKSFTRSKYRNKGGIENETLNLNGYAVYIVYNISGNVINHAHFVPTRLRTKETEYQRYMFEYFMRVYPEFECNQKYLISSNSNWEKELDHTMVNRGLDQDKEGASSVVPYK
ncbi:MAG TPA: hypothetical protein VFV52_08010 [Bacilli bacterium]|nr:hypothetical protein [Bacilli bacterium]